jgi:hypothetical protein
MHLPLKAQFVYTTNENSLTIVSYDIDCLKNLHTGQLQQLRVFVETLGYRKAVERASEEFNQPIHKSALQRFMRRAAPADFIEDTPENDEAMRQILKFAADGQPDFTSSTIRALEQLAFQLAFTCTAMDEDMNALTKISIMLCRFRHAAVRERMAVVQEGKLKLRQQQFEKTTNSDDDKKIRDLNEKIAAAFDSHPVLTAIRNGEDTMELGRTPAEEAPRATEIATVPPKTKNAKSSPLSRQRAGECRSTLSQKSPLVAPKPSESGKSAVHSPFSPLTPVQNSYENTQT